MNREQIMESIKKLGYSVGRYGRLYEFLSEMKENDKEQYEVTMSNLEKQNFKDATDMVMFLES